MTVSVLDAETARRLATARIGRLATVDDRGRPAVVPVCFAMIERAGEPVLVSVLDEKPKRVGDVDLARVRNISHQPEVMLVVDQYSENWSHLNWVQVRGRASLLDPGDPDHAAAIAALRTKYPQYLAMAIHARPVIVIRDLTTRQWAAGDSGAGDSGAGDSGAGDSGAGDSRSGTRPVPRPGSVELAEVIPGRRSVRSFASRPVPRSVIEQAISAAGWAPSPHGRQPWRFAVVERAARREALAEAMAASWESQLLLDGQDPAIRARRLARSQERLRQAPVLVIPCLYLADVDVYPDPARQAAETTMAVQSLGAAIQNFLLTIYAAGLDAGWMCAPLFCPELVRDHLGLDAAMVPHALIPVGFAAADPVRRERLPLASLIADWQ